VEGFKGFNEDLQCRGLQYEIGKEYTKEEEEEIVICHNGFHFCTEPLDVLDYYPPPKSRYCLVEGAGTIVSEEELYDSKMACEKIRILREIDVVDFIEHAIYRHPYRTTPIIAEGENDIACSEEDTAFLVNALYRGISASSGKASVSLALRDGGVAAVTARKSVARSNGKNCVSASTECSSAAATIDMYSVAAATGFDGTAICKSSNSVCLSTGEYSEAISTEKHSMSINTGENGYAAADGYSSVAAALGDRGAAKGGVGCWIILAEHRFDEDGVLHIVDIQNARVDGEIVKADTWYKLVNGKIRAV